MSGSPVSSEISISTEQIQACSGELRNAADGFDEDAFTLPHSEFPGVPTRMHSDVATSLQASLSALSQGMRHDAKALIAAKDFFVQADECSAQKMRGMGG